MNYEEINSKIRQIIEGGNYISKHYYEPTSDFQKRMKDNEYHYNIATADNILHFTSKKETYEIPAKEFEWRMLWDKLSNVPVNEDDELEESFEHFEAGTDKEDVWRWFEWFFDISLGKELFS